PVVRGSFLLKFWFSEAARNAADIDLEFFVRTQATVLHTQLITQPSVHASSNLGRFGTTLNYARTLCMYAAQRGRYDWSDHNPPPIAFTEVDVPEDGVSLWEYDSPGVRCYTGWVWNALGGESGLLQIDIAQATAYDLNTVSLVNMELTNSQGERFKLAAYT